MADFVQIITEDDELELTRDNRSSDKTLTADDDVIVCTGACTITLMDATSVTNKPIYILNSSTSTITVDTDGGTINGSASITLTAQYDAVTFMTIGPNYMIVADTR